jgi:hypothetical protein
MNHLKTIDVPTVGSVVKTWHSPAAVFLFRPGVPLDIFRVNVQPCRVISSFYIGKGGLTKILAMSFSLERVYARKLTVHFFSTMNDFYTRGRMRYSRRVGLAGENVIWKLIITGRTHESDNSLEMP